LYLNVKKHIAQLEYIYYFCGRFYVFINFI